MDNFKLRTYDGIAVACYLMMPCLFYTGLSDLVKENGSAAWIALLLSFMLILCIFLIIASLMKRYQGKNIIEISEMILGKPFALAYSIMLGVYLCYFTGIYIREGIELLKIYTFTNTPIYVIAGLIIFTAVIMNVFGGRAIFKSVSFFFMIMLLSVAFVLILGMNRYNPDYLFPVLGTGIHSTALNSICRMSMFDSVILLTLFAPLFKDTQSLKKTGMLSIITAFTTSILFCLCYIMMFSPSIASILNSGFIEMGKSSYYNHFFYRFESILLIFLVFFTSILASLGLFAARKSVSCASSKKLPNTTIVLCGSTIAIFTFIPENMVDLAQYLLILRQYSVLLIGGFPLLLFIIDRVKKVIKNEKI